MYRHTSTVRMLESRMIICGGNVKEELRGSLPLGLSTRWERRWMVIFRDRRPNTGGNANLSRVQCPNLACRAITIPPIGQQTYTCNCGQTMKTPIYYQLALYRDTHSPQPEFACVINWARAVAVQDEQRQAASGTSATAQIGMGMVTSLLKSMVVTETEHPVS